ncbi:MAG TPA: MBL fold metallo-hydrolase [Dehalococcoidales bacterium]|nr:MBL fold metallo-hydrolase [Dehalococcoidales bacterium]
MLIKFLAHAAFLITAQNGTKIIIDPYHSGPGFSYKPVTEPADIVTKSHDHGDHNAIETVQGNPVVISEPGNRTVKGIAIKGTAVFHDTESGKARGKNIVFCFNVDGLNICHLGDLGHALTSAQVEAVKPVDILLVPVGGFFTIDAGVATTLVSALKPGIIIPMHYKTSKAESLPIAAVDDFLKNKKNVRKLDSSVLEVTRATLPAAGEIVVLKPAN